MVSMITRLPCHRSSKTLRHSLCRNWYAGSPIVQIFSFSFPSQSVVRVQSSVNCLGVANHPNLWSEFSHSVNFLGVANHVVSITVLADSLQVSTWGYVQSSISCNASFGQIYQYAPVSAPMRKMQEPKVPSHTNENTCMNLSRSPASIYSSPLSSPSIPSRTHFP